MVSINKILSCQRIVKTVLTMRHNSAPSLVQREMGVIIYPSQAFTARLQTSKHAVQLQNIWRTSSSWMTSATCRFSPDSTKCRWTVMVAEWQAFCPLGDLDVSLLCPWPISWNDWSRNDTVKSNESSPVNCKYAFEKFKTQPSGTCALLLRLHRGSRPSIQIVDMKPNVSGYFKTNTCMTNVRTTKREDNARFTHNWRHTANLSTQFELLTSFMLSSPHMVSYVANPL